MNSNHDTLINELITLLTGKGAHVSFSEAVERLPANLRGVKPDNMPYSIWQLVEHIRIAQWDMLEFSRDTSHESPKWPDEYWPDEAAPGSDDAWDASLKKIDSDLQEFINLLKNADNIYEPFGHGSGQNLLREALQIADHTAYHTGEILAIRRMLCAWT
ncbi:DinB family protein [Mucilaginibacter sp. UR6-1]|uniref:DinB family protein n=1 Tax=Mucilaginibacter sp. UR6-1 TaxID=1435643 RepID=UPI001E5FEBAA|nr:DinB family protein [Mucilaginibacter sp. UR6-1]MCC8409732.1 DinB family protein [Mucilaginibacter sp. UR6-1]